MALCNRSRFTASTYSDVPWDAVVGAPSAVLHLGAGGQIGVGYVVKRCGVARKLLAFPRHIVGVDRSKVALWAMDADTVLVLWRIKSFKACFARKLARGVSSGPIVLQRQAVRGVSVFDPFSRSHVHVAQLRRHADCDRCHKKEKSDHVVLEEKGERKRRRKLRKGGGRGRNLI